jgi:cob(I)alamin adenosyltransferase
VGHRARDRVVAEGREEGSQDDGRRDRLLGEQGRLDEERRSEGLANEGSAGAERRSRATRGDERRGYVHVYTGDGKGKTTAALGLALRALGHDLRVIMVQFMKADPSWGEIVMARRIGLDVLQVGLDHWVRKGEVTADDLRAAAEGFARGRDIVLGGAYDVVILDELLTALYFELVSRTDVLRLFAEKPQHVELVVTGRRAPDDVVAAADLVTEMRPVKHYFDAGVPAREGIEF